MDIDHPLRASHPVLTVDVLGEHPHLEVLLQLSDDPVGSVWTGAATCTLDLHDVLPRQSRIALKHRLAQRNFDGHALVGLDPIVEATDPSIGWQTGVHTDPGTGDEQHPLAPLEALDDARHDRFIHLGHCGHYTRGRVSRFTLVTAKLKLPALVIHGGAGAYLKTTTAEQRLKRGKTLEAIVRAAQPTLRDSGARAGVLSAIGALERDASFNAGYGSRLQQDGVARLSASLMDGQRARMSAVYNVQDCLLPSALCDVLQDRADRNIDGDGARLLMQELGVASQDVRTPRSIERWQKLVATGDVADREAAIGDAGQEELDKARQARIPVPRDLDDPNDNKYGTVGAVGCDEQGQLWACTSTGGRGHEAVGRISDSPTAAGNYACPVVALSATGFGEQIIDLNLCGRIATRMLDGASLTSALTTTFEEVADFGGLLGVIAVAADGRAGYAHSTDACGVAWIDATGSVHIDQHGRSQDA